jgi:hypothetical protein
MGRKPTVGGDAEKHSQFAREVTSYLDRVRQDSGLSIRGVAAQTPGQRSNSWWADIFNGSKVLTTNDVHFIATELLGISPYRFIENAQAAARGEDVPWTTFYVRALDDDYHELTQEQELALRQSEVELAAYRDRNRADVGYAE